MNTPSIIQVCEKNPERRAQLAKDFNGAWLADNLLGVPGPSGRADFSAARVLESLLGSPPMWMFNLKMGLTEFSNDANQPSFSLNGWKNVGIDLAIMYGPPISDPPVVSVGTRIANGLLTSSRKCLIERATDTLQCLETKFVYALHRRRFFGLCLTQVVRVLNRFIFSGNFNSTNLIRAAQCTGSKFTQAAVALALRGFKSKRFVPRPLKITEPVRLWYDHASTPAVIRAKQQYGTVVQCQEGSAKIIVKSPSLGNLTHRYGAGYYDVWPMER